MGTSSCAPGQIVDFRFDLAPKDQHNNMQFEVEDYSDVVVHILQPDAREYYDIDRLYDDCPRLGWTPSSDDERASSAGA